MKQTGIEALTKSLTGTPGATTPVPGSQDNFLGRVNTTINNFKSLMKLASDLGLVNTPGGQPGGQPGTRPVSDFTPPPAKNPGKPGNNWQHIFQALMDAGFGDVPIGKILEQVSPYTINQLQGMAKNVKPKK